MSVTRDVFGDGLHLPSSREPDDGAAGLVVGQERVVPPPDDQDAPGAPPAVTPPRPHVAPLATLTATDLMATDFPEPRYAVPDIVTEGLNLLAGSPKLGKSWLALGLCVAVSAGGHALGKIPVERGESLYLALEDPPRRLKQRLGAVLDGQPAPEGLHTSSALPSLTEGALDLLDGWLVQHPDCRLLVVDVLAKVRGPVTDRGSLYTQDYQALSGLKALSDSRGVATLVVHHTRKANSDDFLDTVSGTHGLAAAADTVLVMRRSRGQADAELHVTGRDVEERELALRFDPLLGSWALLGDASEWALSETRRTLLAAVREHGPVTPKQADDLTGLGYELVKNASAHGRRRADRHRGRPLHPVPPVPAVPRHENRGHGGHGGQSLRG